MKYWLQKSFFIIALTAMISACSTPAPTWSGISETEIANWKGLNIGPGDAQTYRKEGLVPEAVQQWQENNFNSVDAVLTWHKSGFAPAEAKGWVTGGFSNEAAQEWKEKAFSSEDASQWKQSGFELDAAIDNRDKGLTPVEPDAPEESDAAYP